MRSTIGRIESKLVVRHWRLLVVLAVAAAVVAFPARATGPSTPASPTELAAGATFSSGDTPAPALTQASTPAPTPAPTLMPMPTETATETATETPPAPPTPAPTPSPTPAQVLLCRASQLQASVSLWSSVSGVTTSHIAATNGSNRLCFLRGEVEAQVVDGDDQVVADSGVASAGIEDADPFFPLHPGDEVSTTVTWSNWCGSGPAQPLTLALVLPEGLGRVVARSNGHTPIPLCTGVDDTKASSARWTP